MSKHVCRLIWLSSVMSCFVAGRAATPQQQITLPHSITLPQNSGLTIVLNNTQIPTATQHISGQQSSEQVATQTAAPAQQMARSYNTMRNQIVLMMQQHPLLVVGATTIATYGAIVAYLYYVFWHCTTHCHWAYWRVEVPVDAISTKARYTYAQELFKAINTMYARERAAGDFLTPLVCFANAIAYELAWHERFLKAHAFLDTIPFHALLPQQLQMRAAIQQQHDRLIALHQLLIAWLSEYTNDDHGNAAKKA